jgi:hypothetical protein
VTTLGEFSPIGQSFALGSFFNARSKPIFWLLLLHDSIYELIWQKNVLGYILGDFFRKPTGHPVGDLIKPTCPPFTRQSQTFDNHDYPNRSHFKAGLPDFSWSKHTKTEKIPNGHKLFQTATYIVYQRAINHTKWP